MTVIAWDKKTLAAERLVTVGDRVFGYEKKILRYNDGWWASRGDVIDGEQFKAFLNDSVRWKPAKDFEGIFTKGKHVYIVDRRLTYWEITNHLCAIGSGGEVAEALLHEGYTAKEAVKAACRQIVSCGGKVDVVKIT